MPKPRVTAPASPSRAVREARVVRVRNRTTRPRAAARLRRPNRREGGRFPPAPGAPPVAASERGQARMLPGPRAKSAVAPIRLHDRRSQAPPHSFGCKIPRGCGDSAPAVSAPASAPPPPRLRIVTIAAEPNAMSDPSDSHRSADRAALHLRVREGPGRRACASPRQLPPRELPPRGSNPLSGRPQAPAGRSAARIRASAQNPSSETVSARAVGSIPAPRRWVSISGPRPRRLLRNILRR